MRYVPKHVQWASIEARARRISNDADRLYVYAYEGTPVEAELSSTHRRVITRKINALHDKLRQLQNYVSTTTTVKPLKTFKVKPGERVTVRILP